MKRNVLALFFILFSTGLLFSQREVYQLSTHILDITEGKPAPNVTVLLEKQTKDKWVKIADEQTDNAGRIADFLPADSTMVNANDGVYRLTFFTQPYFKEKSVDSFYPFIEVVFEIKGDTHYHVPITLSPYGYSTYRGS